MISPNDYSAEVVRVIRSLFPSLQSKDISSNTSLTEDLGLNSLSLMELVVELENIFAIEVPDQALDPENFSDVTKISHMISQLKSLGGE